MQRSVDLKGGVSFFGFHAFSKRFKVCSTCLNAVLRVLGDCFEVRGLFN